MNNTNFPAYSDSKYFRMTLYQPKKKIKKILQKALVEIILKRSLLINSDVKWLSIVENYDVNILLPPKLNVFDVMEKNCNNSITKPV